MTKISLRGFCIAAICAGAVTCATLLSVPMPGFRLYFNLGEGIIYSVALIFGGPAGALCGGMGAALADLLLGYTLWAPFTFCIKAAEGYIVGKMAPRGTKSALFCGAVIMVTAYTLMASVLYGRAAAPVELFTDIIQSGIGIICALFLVPHLRRVLPKLKVMPELENSDHN